ncbi:MAG: hypothetical protein LUG23_07060 [Oscillospiraceae bacterium]|nr:hypothetical protein [Oscillospiraceae bacterium]
MENAAVLVSTPFQLLSAIAITEQLHEYTYDLYILGNFTGYKNLAEKVKETGIFENVKAYEIGQIRKKTASSPKIVTHLEEIQKYIMYDKTAETVLVPNKKYDAIFFATAHSFVEIIFYAKKN